MPNEEQQPTIGDVVRESVTAPPKHEDPAAAPLVVRDDNYMLPKDLSEAIHLAQLLSKSTMVPRDYIDKPGNCLLAIQMGAELGLKPFQAIQGMAVIGNRPGLFGDAGKALLMKHGVRWTETPTEEVKRNAIASCTMTRPGFNPVTKTFSKEDAERANLWNKEGPWRNYPYRQMQWRAWWWAAREIAADILKGMGGAEEISDIPRDVTAEGSVERVPMPQSTKATNGHAEHATATSTADTTPASEGMLKHMKKRLENAALSMADVKKQFPDVVEEPGVFVPGLTVAQCNAILAWTSNPAG